MIKSVTVTNHLGESLTLELTGPEKSGLAIQEITGIGPSKADINVVEIVTKDGGDFNSTRLTSRNIVITLVCVDKKGDPTFTVEDGRHLSYKYFPIKNEITLQFETDNRTSKITGYVESNEPTIFSDRETIQVSIICPDPFFYSVDDIVSSQAFFGVEKKWEFPWDNNSTTEKLIEFGEIKHHPEQTIYYDGEYDVGITINMHFTGTVINPKIINLSKNETMGLISDKIATLTGSNLKAGDSVFINTRKGQKSVTLFRDGVSTNILSCLENFSVWHRLEHGDNLFTYDSDYGAENVSIVYQWAIAYEGV